VVREAIRDMTNPELIEAENGRAWVSR